MKNITEMTTSELIAAKQSMIESKGLYINGRLPLTDEQVVELDARGWAVSEELTKRLAASN